MSQQHPSLIIRTALKSKLEKLNVSFNEEHWVQMENIIIAQPKSVVIKTPLLLLQVFYSILTITTIACIIFCPQTNAPKAKPVKYNGDLLVPNKTKKINFTKAATNYKAAIIIDSLAVNSPIKPE